MAAARKLTLTILGNAKSAVGALSATQNQSKSLSSTLASISKKVTVAFGAVSAAGVVLGKQVADGLIMATKAAAEDQKAQELLARQVRESVGATDEQVAALERYIGKTQFSAAVSDGELRPALGNLVRATGDLTKAQDLLNLSLDISAATGKDLESVSIALGKAQNGNIAGLTRLGIPLDENTKKTKDFAAAQVALEKQFGGASAVAASSFEGQLKKVKIAIDETVETIGYAIINNPQFKKAFEAVTTGAQVFAENLGDKGIKGATYMALAAMKDFGRGTIDVVEAVSLAVLKLLEKLLRWTQTAAEAVALLAAAKGNAVLAAKAMGTAYFAMKGLGEVRNAIAGLPGFFDDLRRNVEGAAMAMNQFGGKTLYEINMVHENAGKKIPKVKKEIKDLGDGIGGSSKTVETAQDKLKKFIDALKETSSAQKAAKEATKALKSANEDLAEVNVRLKAAQDAFNQAVRGYGKDSVQAKNQQNAVNKATRGVERANYGVEQATFAVKDAEKELAEVRADPETNPQMIREAEIRLAEAKLSVVDAIDAQAEAVRDQAEAQQKLDAAINGVKEGSEEYNDLLKELKEAEKDQLAAIDRVTEAREREAEAIYNVAKAERELAELRATTPDRIEREAEAEVARTLPTIPTTPPTGTTPPAVNVAKSIRDAFMADAITGADVALFQRAQSEGRTANITIQAGVGDPVVIANTVIDALKQYERANGYVPVTAQYVAG